MRGRTAHVCAIMFNVILPCIYATCTFREMFSSSDVSANTLQNTIETRSPVFTGAGSLEIQGPVDDALPMPEIIFTETEEEMVYKALHLIGEGSYGKVWMYHFRSVLDDSVFDNIAVKFPKDGENSEIEAIQTPEWYEEHPEVLRGRVVSMKASGDKDGDDGQPNGGIIAMELMNQGSLHDYSRYYPAEFMTNYFGSGRTFSTPLSRMENQIIACLDAAEHIRQQIELFYRKGLVYTDLKFQNVLVNMKDETKGGPIALALGDFGSLLPNTKGEWTATYITPEFENSCGIFKFEEGKIEKAPFISFQIGLLLVDMLLHIPGIHAHVGDYNQALASLAHSQKDVHEAGLVPSIAAELQEFLQAVFESKIAGGNVDATALSNLLADNKAQRTVTVSDADAATRGAADAEATSTYVPSSLFDLVVFKETSCDETRANRESQSRSTDVSSELQLPRQAYGSGLRGGPPSHGALLPPGHDGDDSLSPPWLGHGGGGNLGPPSQSELGTHAGNGDWSDVPLGSPKRPSPHPIGSPPPLLRRRRGSN